MPAFEPSWFIWSCHNCQRSGCMTFFNTHCVDCNHLRCPDCPVEILQADYGQRSVRNEFTGLFLWNSPSTTSKQYSLQSSIRVGSKSNTQTFGLFRTNTTRPSQSEASSTTTTAGFSSYLAKVPGEIDSGLKEDPPSSTEGGPQGTASTSDAFPTSESSSQSPKTSPSVEDITPNMETVASSDTELENSDSELEEEDEEAAYCRHVLQVLDAQLLEVFSQHLELAANILPQIHTTIFRAPSNSKTIPAEPCGNKNSDQQPNSGSSGSQDKAASNNKRSGKQPAGKRQRDRNEGDEGGDDDGSPGGFRAVRPRRMTVNTVKFACHFHKRNPNYYNGATRRYKNCPHPSIPLHDLRRIKDHFKAAHVAWQCDSCHQFFFDDAESVAHRRLEDCTPSNTSSLEEGINEVQWKKIETIIRKRGDSEVKWREIWQTLFPGIKTPPHPYQETYTQSTVTNSLIIDVPSRIEQFRRLVEIGRENEVIKRDDPVPERYILALQQILNDIGMEQMSAVPESSSRATRTSSMQSPEWVPVSESIHQPHRMIDDVGTDRFMSNTESHLLSHGSQPQSSPEGVTEFGQPETITTQPLDIYRPGEHSNASWTPSPSDLVHGPGNILSPSTTTASNQDVYASNFVDCNGVDISPGTLDPDAAWNQFYYQ